jgi:branched-chain amino acid transport system ATP-binding protein
LRFESVDAGYKKLRILFQVNATFEDKRITVIVGPNGSGKSTLLKSIFGLTSIHSGTIMLDECNLVGLQPDQIARKGIAFLPQVENVFANLSVRENMMMAGYTLEDAVDRTKEALEFFPRINSFYDRKASTLSGGERQMVAMAMALVRRPRLMLFDEPTGHMAPKVAAEILTNIVKLRDKHGITILLAEQNAKRALECGDNALLLVSGRPIFTGKADDLLSHKELGKLYLGIA